MIDQGRNLKENFGATMPMVGRICPPPPGWNRVKESENLGATLVAPVAPLDTSLIVMSVMIDIYQNVGKYWNELQN